MISNSISNTRGETPATKVPSDPSEHGLPTLIALATTCYSHPLMNEAHPKPIGQPTVSVFCWQISRLMVSHAWKMETQGQTHQFNQVNHFKQNKRANGRMGCLMLSPSTSWPSAGAWYYWLKVGEMWSIAQRLVISKYFGEKMREIDHSWSFLVVSPFFMGKQRQNPWNRAPPPEQVLLWPLAPLRPPADTVSGDSKDALKKGGRVMVESMISHKHLQGEASCR